MEHWKIDIIRIADVKGIRAIWKWTPAPPPRIIWECLKDRMCAQCHGTVSPFIFIGRLPDGRYMAFRRPVWLLRNGCTGLVLIPPPAPTLFTQPAQTQVPIQIQTTIQAEVPTPVPEPMIVKVVDVTKPKKRSKKTTKAAPKATPKKAPQKPTKKPVKKVVKKTPVRRRNP
jgi:hypothetical protein